MSSAAIPAQCAAVAQEVQAQTTSAFVTEINQALPIVFLIWLSFGVWLGDWSNSFSDEWNLIKRGFTPAGVSYFLARLGGGLAAFCYTLTTMIGGKGTLPGSCHSTDKALAVFYCLCSIGAQATFMLRCVSVWENNPIVRAFLGALLLVIVAAFVLFIVVIDGYKTPFGLLVCNINKPPKIEIIATISTVVVDVICIGLTTFKLRRKLNVGRIHQLLFRDGVIYLAIVVLVSGSLTGMLLTNLPDIIRVVLSPIHVVVLSISATRAQRTLRSEGAKMATGSRSAGGSLTNNSNSGSNHLSPRRRLSSNPAIIERGDYVYPLRPSAAATSSGQEDETFVSGLNGSGGGMRGVPHQQQQPFELRKMSDDALQNKYYTASHGRNPSVPPSPWSTPSMDKDGPRSPRFM